MRGQQNGRYGNMCILRIIPARAGPTVVRTRHAHLVSDHPRSCGANGAAPRPCMGAAGSSPLVRGQRNPNTLVRLGYRIIPARAGPTRNLGLAVWERPDHPRSCGANANPTKFSNVQSGSSPLVRGQLASITRKTVSSRIIPARAGPTRSSRHGLTHLPDHPRSCGANLAVWLIRPPSVGSSPLVRGQPSLGIPGAVALRIIPARAGPTNFPAHIFPVHKDHPRSCGANSPAVDTVAIPLRIIPARAGPTIFRIKKDMIWTDHPRSCGANSLILRGKSGLSQIKIFDYSSGIWQ